MIYYIGDQNAKPWNKDHVIRFDTLSCKAELIWKSGRKEDYNKDYVIEMTLSESWKKMEDKDVPVWADIDKQKKIESKRIRLREQVVSTARSYNEAIDALAEFNKENPQ